MTIQDEMIEIRAEMIDTVKELKARIAVFEQIVKYLGRNMGNA